MQLKMLPLLLVAASLQATTYYVAPTGNDSNPGTQASPFQTVTKGVAAAASPGDVVMVGNGTYTNNGVVEPNYVVTLTHSGTAAAPITIQAQNRGQAVLDSGNTSTTTSCNGAASYFNLNNASFVVIQGFVIQHACDSGFQSNDKAHDIVIRWNTIQYIANRQVTDQIGRDGIYLNSSEYNFTFDGNIWHDIGRTSGQSLLHFDHGIYFAAQGLTIINNVFYNMKAGWSIQMASGAANSLIANNTFAFPNTGNGEAGQIMWWSSNKSITVENNIFYLPNSSAMTSFQPSASGTFTSNMLYSVTSTGAPSGVNVGTNITGKNPQFVSATAPYNFALSPGSPAIGTGLTLPQVPTDINGNPRTAPYSLGAYQSGISPPAPPIISQVAAAPQVSALITWATDQPSTSVVNYGITANYGSSTPVNPSLVTSHSVLVPGLNGGMVYHFQVGSTNATGQTSLSNDSTFTTP